MAAAVNPHRVIRPSDIMSNMSTGESPLDFIQKNMGNVAPHVQATPLAPVVEATNPTPAVPQQIQSQAQPATPPAAAPAQAASSVDPLPVFDEKKEEVPPAAEAQPNTDPDDAELGEESPEVLQKEHYQNLRAKAKEARIKTRELEAQLAERDSKLQKYETGEIVPDLLREQNDKIERLSKYEKLINVKTSEEYIEGIAQPLNEKIAKLKETFKGYNIPDEQLDVALNHFLEDRSEAEQNATLLENFDALGAQKVSGLLQEIKGLKAKEQEIDNEPSLFEKLQQEAQARKATEDLKRTTKIKETAQSAWVDTLTEIRNEGKVRELIRSETDSAFNEKFVDPILQESAIQYGKIITELAKQGVKEITKDLAKQLTTMTLKSVTHALAFEARDVALTHLETIEKVADRANMLLRPNIGGGTPRGNTNNGAAQAPSLTPQQAAQQLSNSILRPR